MAAPWFDDLTLQLDEDFDDEEQLSGNFWKVDLQSEKCSEVTCKLLIVSLGDSPYLFTSKFLRPRTGEWEPVAHIRLRKDTDDYASWEKATLKRTESVIWRGNSGAAILECRQEVLPEVSNAWSEAVLDFVKAEQVVVLSTYPAARLQSEENIMDSLPMLRCLTSSTWSHRTPWPLLQSPDVILGCAAAVLTQCQLRRVASAVYSLVIGQADVDMDALALLLQVMDTDVCSKYFADLLSAPRSAALSELRRIIPPPSSSGSMFQ